MVGSSWLKWWRLLVKKVVKHWFKLKTCPVKMRINLLTRSTAFNKIGYIGLHSYACSQCEGTTVFLSGLGLNVPRNKSSPTCPWSWRAFKLEDISCGLISGKGCIPPCLLVVNMLCMYDYPCGIQPRIVEGTCPVLLTTTTLCQETDDEDDDDFFHQYLQEKNTLKLIPLFLVSWIRNSERHFFS